VAPNTETKEANRRLIKNSAIQLPPGIFPGACYGSPRPVPNNSRSAGLKIETRENNLYIITTAVSPAPFEVEWAPGLVLGPTQYHYFFTIKLRLTSVLLDCEGFRVTVASCATVVGLFDLDAGNPVCRDDSTWNLEDSVVQLPVDHVVSCFHMLKLTERSVL